MVFLRRTRQIRFPGPSIETDPLPDIDVDYSLYEWDVEGVRSKLAALGKNPSIESVISVHPNSISSCYSCGQHIFFGATVAESDDYFGEKFFCEDCLIKFIYAVRRLREGT